MATIVPDYRVPDAVMVPHYMSDITALLESIATWISRSCGVILLSQNQDFSQAFISSQNFDSHFSILTAPFDSPWIRDRSPIAVKVAKGFRWCIPQVSIQNRPNDDRLFDGICVSPQQRSAIEFLPQGNIVTGANGLAIVTREVLLQNNFTADDLDNYKKMLGIKHWLIFNNFKREQTGHADVHVRVLSAKLIAIAWNFSVKRDRVCAQQLLDKINNYDAGINIIKIPIRSYGDRYGSLINWLQLGTRLLIPRYSLTPAADIIETRDKLCDCGFNVDFIYSPTLEYSGSVHCLTASIFV